MNYIYLKEKDKTKTKKFSKKHLVFVLLSVGLVFLLLAIVPIIKFQLEYAINLREIISPLSVRNYNRDYTQLGNWFTQNSDNQQLLLPDVQITYSISIPKLKIKNAVVTFGSMDLKKSLIQYPNTALPGQPGNTVIFGHSVLPQFFNAKSYLTIFSTLYKLKVGDDIIINYNNSDYKYKVTQMYEVQPTNLSVLEQRFDSKAITLITCSPPGTYLRRLIVRAELAL